jgi:hypothetical protein
MVSLAAPCSPPKVSNVLFIPVLKGQLFMDLRKFEIHFLKIIKKVDFELKIFAFAPFGGVKSMSL